MTARCKKYDLSFGFSDFLCFFRLSSEIYLYTKVSCLTCLVSFCVFFVTKGWLVVMHGFLTRAEPRARDGPSPCKKFPCFGISSHESILNENSNQIRSWTWSWAIGPLLNWPLSNLLSRSPQIHQHNCGLDLWIIPRVRLGIMFILKIKKSEKTKSQIAFLPDAFCSCVFCVSSLNVALGVISSSIPKLLRHLMRSQKMRTGCDACDARPRLISSRTMRPGDGMKHCLVWKQEPSEFNKAENTRNPRLISAGFTKNSCVPAWREGAKDFYP